MELRQLECFVAVVEESGFTRAAARLHVVQSAVSATIASLERELGAPLLVRTGRRIALTEAGRQLLPKARATLEAARAARDTVHEVVGGIRGTLRVGTMSSLGMIDLPAVLGEFHHAYPEVSVQLAIVATGSAGLVTELAAGRLDLAFISIPGPPPAGVRVHELASVPLDLAVRRDHALAARSEVAIWELADESFVDFPLGYGNRVVTDRAFAAAGLDRHVTIEIADITAGTDFVRHGLGVALLPRVVLVPDEELSVVRVTGADLDWPISLATASGRVPGSAARAFERVARRHLDANA